MGVSQKSINDAVDSFDKDFDPFLGMRKKQKEIDYNHVEIKFAVGCLQDDAFRLFANELMTNSVRHQGNLTKAGDVMVIEQKDTFDKDGCCHMMLKYMEYSPEKDKKDASTNQKHHN